MGATGYLGRLRECVGHDLLLVPSVAACIRDAEGRILILRRGDGVNLPTASGGASEGTTLVRPATLSGKARGDSQEKAGGPDSFRELRSRGRSSPARAPGLPGFFP